MWQWQVPNVRYRYIFPHTSVNIFEKFWCNSLSDNLRQSKLQFKMSCSKRNVLPQRKVSLFVIRAMQRWMTNYQQYFVELANSRGMGMMYTVTTPDLCKWILTSLACSLGSVTTTADREGWVPSKRFSGTWKLNAIWFLPVTIYFSLDFYKDIKY